MKSLIILFILFISIYTNNGINASPTKILEPIQNATAISILEAVYNVSINPSTYEICDDYKFTCLQLNHQYYTVVSIWLHGWINFQESLVAFKDVTSITLEGSVQLPPSFFNDEIKFLTKLEKLMVQFQTSQIPGSAALPLSLKIVIFSQISVPLGVNFFEYGIESLTVVDSLPGFSYPTSLSKINSNMKYLSVRIQSYANLPSNIGNFLPNLNILLISINNIIDPSYSNITFPTLNQFNQLEVLSILFMYEQYPSIVKPRQLFDISTSSIYQLASSLKKLYISYPGLSIDSTGFSDFSNFKPGFSLSLRGTNSLVDGCRDSNCIRMPTNSTLLIYECKVKYHNIDFSNIVSFENYQNTVSQTLPTSGLDNIETLKISDTNAFGDVPEFYCYIDEVAVNYNKLNGTLPPCISTCLSQPDRAKMIVPNSFTNFTLGSPIVCPGFAIDEIPYQLMNTDGSSKLIITGKNLGWNILPGVGNSYSFIVPNKKLEIQIRKGVGKFVPNNIYFNDLYRFTYNISYIPPKIETCNIFKNNSLEYLRICGNGFDYVNNNSITFININKTFEFDSAIEGCTTFRENVDFSTFSTNGNITVEMIVGDQKSNSITFSIFTPASATTTTATSPTTTTSSMTGTNSNGDSDEPSSISKLNPIYANMFLSLLLIISLSSF